MVVIVFGLFTSLNNIICKRDLIVTDGLVNGVQLQEQHQFTMGCFDGTLEARDVLAGKW